MALDSCQDSCQCRFHEAWKRAEAALPEGYGLEVFAYPSGIPYGPADEARYHAYTQPVIDSHLRNRLSVAGPSPEEALSALVDGMQRLGLEAS